MSFNRKLLVAALLSLAIVPLALGMRVSVVEARTLDDIQKEIDKQKQSLNDVNSQLSNAEKVLKSSQASLNSTQGEIPRLEAEIAQIQAEIDLNKIQLQVAEETEKLKVLEQEERETRQDGAIQQAYVDWRSAKRVLKAFAVGTAEDMRSAVYQSQVAHTELGGIEVLAGEIDDIQTNINNLKTSTTDLESKNAELASRKAQLEAQIIALRNSINSANGAVAGLRSQATVLQANIDQLSAEQKALQDYEAWLLGQSGNGGTQPLTAGQLYLTGKGRELYTGHGVGMSQYGAYGLAQNGWGATQILTHYYTGVVVGQYAASQEISIRYCQSNPVFAAYQNGCMSGGVYYGPDITERISLDAYLAGLGEMPNSWPLEARKAQMIAARTYALRYTANGDPNIPICLTTYCQVSYVKSGDQAEMDAVQQTKDLVITYGGNLIEALYSADNNNGWGTADNDTRFSNLAGDGTPYPYLRAVQDSGLSVTEYPGYGHSWTWRTNGYSLASFDQMLAFAQGDGYLTSGSRSYIAGMRGTIGNVAAVNFQRDPSGRVKKVVFTGTNGATTAMAGWFFKTVWNSWVDQVMPTGQKDFIYSQTYYLLTN